MHLRKARQVEWRPVTGVIMLPPRSHRPHTILGHGREFRQHLVDENVDVDKGIPRGRETFWRDGRRVHVLAPMLLMIAVGADGRLFGHGTQLNAELLSGSH
jgi:hypothetical protein